MAEEIYYINQFPMFELDDQKASQSIRSDLHFSRKLKKLPVVLTNLFMQPYLDALKDTATGGILIDTRGDIYVVADKEAKKGSIKIDPNQRFDLNACAFLVARVKNIEQNEVLNQMKSRGFADIPRMSPILFDKNDLVLTNFFNRKFDAPGELWLTRQIVPVNADYLVGFDDIRGEAQSARKENRLPIILVEGLAGLLLSGLDVKAGIIIALTGEIHACNDTGEVKKFFFFHERSGYMFSNNALAIVIGAMLECDPEKIIDSLNEVISDIPQMETPEMKDVSKIVL